MKSRQKVVNFKKLNRQGYGRNKLLPLLVIALVTAVGGYVIYNSHAAPLPNQVSILEPNTIVSYTSGGATTITRSASGKLSYNKVPLQVKLLNDGQIVCNNGSGDSVNNGQLTVAEAQAIEQNVSRMLASVGQSFMGVPNGSGGAYIINPINISVSDGGGTASQAVTVDANAQIPASFNAIENYLHAQCNRADNRMELSALSNVIYPKKNLFASVDKIIDFVSPKAYAFPNAKKDVAIGLYIQQRTNNWRYYHESPSAPLLSWSNCMSDDMTNVSLFEAAFNNNTKNISWRDPSPSDITNCSGNWRYWGANAGYDIRSCTSDAQYASDMFNAYINSPPHRANIENRAYHWAGQGGATASVGGSICIAFVNTTFTDAKIEYP